MPGSFKKFDDSKPMVSLVEPDYILGTAKVLTMGSIKYGPNNWKKAEIKDVSRIKDSLLRHTMAYLNGELIDPESGLSHLHHASCNLMFLSYLEKKFS